MRVIRREVALLRNQLHERLFRSLLLALAMPPWHKLGLQAAAFHLAVHRRFDGRPPAEVIRFVARARIRYGPDGPLKLDPRRCEKMIMEVLAGTGRRAAGVSKWQNAKHMILTRELIKDEQLTDAELEEFIAEAVRLASGWRLLGKHERPSG